MSDNRHKNAGTWKRQVTAVTIMRHTRVLYATGAQPLDHAFDDALTAIGPRY